MLCPVVSASHCSLSSAIRRRIMPFKILFKQSSLFVSEVCVTFWLLFNVDDSWSFSSALDRHLFLAVLGAPSALQNFDKLYLGVVLGTAFSADDT